MVLHVCFVAMCKTKRAKGLTSLDTLALKVASLCHDIDHPGWNNDFEVHSASDKALIYNDAYVPESTRDMGRRGLLAVIGSLSQSLQLSPLERDASRGERGTGRSSSSRGPS